MPEDPNHTGEPREEAGAVERYGAGTISISNDQQGNARAPAIASSAATANASPGQGKRQKKLDLAFLSPLRVASFRWYLSGQAVSRVGDQFYLTALPWLVLTISPTPIAL